jgi:sulfur-carrier protein adenylyltransferase/sulfurtransferase
MQRRLVVAREITAAQLRQYVQEHHEKNYQLVDVRQPSEYQNAHIPGARLFPLPELAKAPQRLPTDVDLIFYCHIGGRSATAAMLVEEEGGDAARIYNLAGGIMAWDGAILADQPRIAIFADQPVAAMLETAMNLEKGALRFYSGAHQRYAGQPWAGLLDQLAQAEIGHARIVYRFAKQAVSDDIRFEMIFDQLSGEILEGGIILEEVLAALPPPDKRACLAVIELALKIENAAYDLYRTMADRTRSDQARQAFLNLAQAEKGHLQKLIDAIGGCPR